MNLMKIPLRNIQLNKKRTISLGFFIFLSALILVLVSSVIETVITNMTTTLTKSITGEVQIRPLNTTEEEMISFTKTWDSLEVYNTEEIESLNAILSSNSEISYEMRLRGSGILQKNTDTAPVNFIGVDTTANNYSEKIKLVEGTFLDNTVENGILIPDTIAKRLSIQVGDEISILTQKDGNSALFGVEIIGTIEVPVLSMFNIQPVFMNITTARTLTGNESNGCSELILFSNNQIAVNKLMNTIEDSLKNGEFDNYKVSTWEDMGGAILGGIQMYMAMFYIFFAIFLIIIAVLMVNMISMMGLERKKDIGTMKAIGFGRKHIIGLFVGEITLISVIGDIAGCLMGTVIAVILSNSVISIGAPLNFALGNEFTMIFKPVTIIPIFLLMIIYAALVSFIPASKLSKLDAVKTLTEA